MKRLIFNGIRFCQSCGKRMLFQGYDVQNRIGYIMDSKQICFECAYWEDMIAYPPDHMEVVGGVILKVLPEVTDKDPTMILGSNGKKRFFLKMGGGILKSNDVWTIATVPEKYLPYFPDTAIELPGKLYQKFLVNSSRCKARSCFDRYRCLRYRIELERETGPYNTIPKDWKVGGEKCRHFIDNQDKEMMKITSQNLNRLWKKKLN